MTEQSEARVMHRFAAPPERVFDAFLDPKQAARFLFATETGEMIRADVDARVGGVYAFVDRRDGEDVLHTGEYLEIDRPRRIVFTLAVPKYATTVARVTIEITPRGAGANVTLTQTVSAAYAERRDAIAKGWAAILARCEDVIARA